MMLYNTSDNIFIIIAFVLVLSSIFLFGITIAVYVIITSMLNNQLENAERNTHEVMDSVMRVLIPENLLEQIAASEGSKNKSKKEKSN